MAPRMKKNDAKPFDGRQNIMLIFTCTENSQ